MLTTTVLYAASSAATRSTLNLIDRYVYATRRRSITSTMVVNLLLPLGGCGVAASAVSSTAQIGAVFLSFAAFVPAAVIQVVSYSYASAFRRCSIASVALDAKLGEILVPMALVPWTGLWSPLDYVFYVLSFAAFIPMMRGGRIAARLKDRAAWWVAGATLMQAMVFFLWPPVPGGTSFTDSIVFHTCVLAWRALLSVAVLLAQPWRRHIHAAPMVWADVPILLFRGACFLMTQVTFLIALRQPDAHLAWPILNATSLLSALAAAPILKERLKADEMTALVLLTAVVIVRTL